MTPTKLATEIAERLFFERNLLPIGDVAKLIDKYGLADYLNAQAAREKVLRDALEQWMQGEAHSEAGELVAASFHYDEAIKLTRALLAQEGK